MLKLKFGFGNAKLSKRIVTFSLPAGYSCPFAKYCLSKANPKTGKITDGKFCRVRCYAASQEAVYPIVRMARWFNYDLLRKCKTVEEMVELIETSIPENTTIIRAGVSGDFYTEMYFKAWLLVAIRNPNIIIYGYTKAIPYLVKYKKHFPKNFRFTASKGGTCDNLIKKYKLRFAEIVFSVKEAVAKKLEIDTDDSHALYPSKSFAIRVHGTQPVGSEASKAWSIFKKEKKEMKKASKVPINQISPTVLMKQLFGKKTTVR